MTASAHNPHHEILSLVRTKNWADALVALERALAVEPSSRLLLLRAQVLVNVGRLRDAAEAAALAQRSASGDVTLLDAIGNVYSRANDQQRALEAFNQAVALAPDNPQPIFNRATVHRFLGAFAAAEADYDRVIALNPSDYEAYKNRSELRTQTAANNHVAQLENLLTRPGLDWRREVQLRYTLAKEYEDLGDYENSFRNLQRGASARRKNLQYDVANDVSTVDWIIDAYPRARGAALAAASPPAAAAAPPPNASGPIFIVGLPRSGSTLVERILSSHSAVHSAGELSCLALVIVDTVRRQSGPPPASRRELVARSATVDFAALGRDYLNAARSAGATGQRFTDKMPLNYLYCGLIRRALPNARIVHVTRHPMAACYAMYKTLFEDGYPFSYDLEDIARYYIGYRRLMDHWQATIPETIHCVSYESLVADQLGQTRQLLEFCGLEWEDACVRFHQNPSATTTASAAQVRKPIYDSSVSQWRHYETQLREFSDRLSAAGISGQSTPL